MKTVTIQQSYDVVSKITFVTCHYRNKQVISSIMEASESLEDFIFPMLVKQGFTHWKSSNGLIGVRKIKVTK